MKSFENQKLKTRNNRNFSKSMQIMTVGIKFNKSFNKKEI
jgi:hypothetical protein